MTVHVSGTLAKAVIGLDVSTRTGVVVLRESDEPEIATVVEAEVLKGIPPVERMRRVIAYGKEVGTLIKKVKPALAVVEGYSHGSRFSFSVLVETGTVVRLALMDAGVPFVEIAPSSLKKFVTGKGQKVKKEQMMLAVFKRWGYEAPGNDLADAYGLARIGLCIMGQAPMTNEYERSLVGTIPRPR